jgi:hypothetical protein
MALLLRDAEGVWKGRGCLAWRALSSCSHAWVHRAAELGLTRKEVNAILSEVDENNDGEVSYEEFIPICFNILVERFKVRAGLLGLLHSPTHGRATFDAPPPACSNKSSHFHICATNR